MNCRRFENELADWIGGRLPATVAAQMQAHAAACPTCERMAEGERGLRAAWRDLPPVAEAPDLWPQLAARIAEVRPAPARPSWFAWLPPVGPSLRYGLAGVGAAMLLATIVMSRHSVPNVGSGNTGIAVNQPQPAVNERQVIDLVSEQQALLPEADGDLAIVATPRYRQAERFVLGQSATR
jgi:hypothetical protein